MEEVVHKKKVRLPRKNRAERKEPSHSWQLPHSLAPAFRGIQKALKITIDSVLSQGKADRPSLQVYRDVENICVLKHEERRKLVAELYLSLDTFTLQTLERIRSALENNTKEAMTQFDTEIGTWDSRITLLSQLFVYVDRVFLHPHAFKQSLKDYSIHRLQEGFRNWISEGDTRPTSLVGDIFEGWFTGRLEGQAASSFIRRVHCIGPEDIWIPLVIERMQKLEKTMLSQKSELENQYLSRTVCVIGQWTNFLMDCGFTHKEAYNSLKQLRWNLIFRDWAIDLRLLATDLFREENIDVLRTLYKLCQRVKNEMNVETVAILKLVWGNWYQESTQQLIKASLDVVLDFSDFYAKALAKTEDLFRNEEFTFEVRKGLSRAIETPEISIIILNALIKYVDSFFKLRIPKIEDDYENFENTFLTVFNLLPRKMEFVPVYEERLAKRLIMGRRENFIYDCKLADAMTRVLGKLDGQIRYPSMIKQVEESRSVVETDSSGLEFEALVLSKSEWPRIPNLQSGVNLPEKYSNELTKFKSLYDAKEERRRHQVFDWSSFSAHQLTVAVNFPKGTRELVICMYQMLVLNCLEDEDSVSFSHIQGVTNMENPVLHLTIKSLSTPKYPVLKVIGDLVCFNNDFECKSTRIRIPLSAKDTTAAPKNFVREISLVVDRSRETELRSLLVRTMKSEKTLHFSELLNTALTRVPGCTDREVKAQIEHLISEEYISRDDTGLRFVYIP